MAFECMDLAALGVAPVSEQEFLQEKALDLYVRFPFDKKVMLRCFCFRVTPVDNAVHLFVITNRNRL